MKRGWCPGVYEPMASGDGLLIRVKPFGGRLTAEQITVIADVSARCGNGAIELTSRGNLQLRGLTERSVAAASAALVAAGLADADPVRERRRNVIAVPPCDDALVAAIEAVLVEIEGLAPKFCVAVGNAAADIVVRDGMVGSGAQWEFCAPADVAAAVRRLAVAAGGLRLAPAPKTPSLPGLSRQSHPPDGDCLAASAIAGTSPAMTEGGTIHLGLPFGQTDAAAFHGLAALIGTSVIRTTPWRALHLCGSHDPAPFAALGFITDTNDPRRSIAACAGAPACASASVAARTDAVYLAEHGLRNIHVSGCKKGCAHHAPATTLVGVNGRYDLVRHGRAGDPPDAFGLTLAEAAEMLA